MTQKTPSKPWSLAARLTVWYALATLVVILVSLSMLYVALRHSLGAQADQFILEKVRSIRQVLRDHPTEPREISDEVAEGWVPRQPFQVYIRVIDAQHHVVAESPSATAELDRIPFPPPGPDETGPQSGTDIRSDVGRPFRVIVAQGRLGQTPSFDTIQIALDTHYQERLTRSYLWQFWRVLAVAVILATSVGYLIARRGIGAMEKITATARQIRSTTLYERIDTAHLPAELAALAETFNQMLARLEEAFGRLSRFTADIAHELRTPVNNLKGEIDVALQQPRDMPEYRRVLESSSEECNRLARIIDNLLFLARSEDPRRHLVTEPRNLQKELETLREFYDAAVTDAGIRLTTRCDANLVANVDRLLFQRAIGNLLDNALANTPRGGEISLLAEPTETGVRLIVRDTGRGIPADALPHVFDRLYRVDPSRSVASGGAGLGLAIVQVIASLHGGTVTITSTIGQGTSVQIDLPADRAVKN